VITLHNEDTKAEDQYALSVNSIGIGKYAKVYRAVNMKDPNRVFAVKVIKIESEEVKKEYLKELKIIKSLPDCPNLVKIHKQHLESDKNLYIFQEYCESGTLLHYRNEKMGVMLREDEIYDVFFQISNGLITLLEAGIIH
jgi:serine/threonine protein kinase